ncbi:MAG: ABC transporter permease [Verrucomicrobia bacterium]|nr:ABC transporter permease [Verrucomicrobiota bacterium]
MRALRTIWSRLRSLWQRREVKREIDEELRFHLEQRTAENVAAGMSPEDAAREARKRFGNVQSVREECGEARGASFGEGTWKDVRFAIRQLLKSPGFTAVAVISLALGIGANTAIFSGLNAVLLRSLPVRDAQDLRLINWTGRNPQYSGYTGPGTTDVPGGFTVGTSFSYPGYCVLRDGNTGFSDVYAFATKGVTLVGHGESRFTEALLVSGNYFSGYGVRPFIGRPILPEDDQPGAPLVAVITYPWWERQCGSDPNVVGKPVTINQHTATVIGVLPRNYAGPLPGDEATVYLPLNAQPQLWSHQPLELDRWWLQVMGRLAPGANEAQAQAGLSVLFQQALNQSKTKMEQGGIVLEDGSRGQLILHRQMAKPFLALTAAAGIVLLIACANLAGLLLARGAARRHEMAVRAAMGAGRWRLIRQSLVESLTLSLLGAGLGLLVAAWSRPALLGFLLEYSRDDTRFDLQTDDRVLAFTVLVSVITAVIFGILPAIRAAEAHPAEALKHRSAMAAPRLTLGKGLVAMQVSLSVLLVVGAGLMIRTFANLARVAPGFDAENVLVFRVRPSDAGHPREQYVEVYDRIRSAVAALPGVRLVSYSAFALVSGSSSSDEMELPGRPNESGRKRNIEYLKVGEDFFRTMNVPLLAGRDFTSADSATAHSVVVVNQTFARRYFPDEDPVGKTFTFHDQSPHSVEIVGVVRDTKCYRVRADAEPLIYVPQRQSATRAVSFAVRSVLPPGTLLPAIRQAVAGIDPHLPLFSISTQQVLLDRSIAPDRLFALLGGALALLALLLSCVGLYGLMAYNVARRTPEIGLRMALGATPRNVSGPILREALWLVLAGLAVGVPGALALVRLVQSQLYGVAPADPVTFVCGGALLIVVAMLSAWIPARRAARVDPMVALRCD